MPPWEDIDRKPFFVRGEFSPALHHAFVRAGVLGPRKGDEAEGQGGEGRVGVVVAGGRGDEGKDRGRDWSYKWTKCQGADT